MIKTMTNQESKFLRRSKFIESTLSRHVVLCHSDSFIRQLYLSSSSSSLFSALREESKHFFDEVSRNVPCEDVPPSKECEVCHNEQCILHRYNRTVISVVS
jgi:hypothetical protein